MTSCTGGGGGTFGDKEKRRPGKREKRGLAYKHPPFGRLNTQGKVLDALQSFCQLFFECHPNHLHTQKKKKKGTPQHAKNTRNLHTKTTKSNGRDKTKLNKPKKQANKPMGEHKTNVLGWT
jgi:hypothetical protein